MQQQPPLVYRHLCSVLSDHPVLRSNTSTESTVFRLLAEDVNALLLSCSSLGFLVHNVLIRSRFNLLLNRLEQFKNLSFSASNYHEFSSTDLDLLELKDLRELDVLIHTPDVQAIVKQFVKTDSRLSKLSQADPDLVIYRILTSSKQRLLSLTLMYEPWKMLSQDFVWLLMTNLKFSHKLLKGYLESKEEPKSKYPAFLNQVIDLLQFIDNEIQDPAHRADICQFWIIFSDMWGNVLNRFRNDAVLSNQSELIDGLCFVCLIQCEALLHSSLSNIWTDFFIRWKSLVIQKLKAIASLFPEQFALVDIISVLIEVNILIRQTKNDKFKTNFNLLLSQIIELNPHLQSSESVCSEIASVFVECLAVGNYSPENGARLAISLYLPCFRYVCDTSTLRRAIVLMENLNSANQFFKPDWIADGVSRYIWFKLGQWHNLVREEYNNSYEARCLVRELQRFGVQPLVSIEGLIEGCSIIGSKPEFKPLREELYSCRSFFQIGMWLLDVNKRGLLQPLNYTENTTLSPEVAFCFLRPPSTRIGQEQQVRVITHICREVFPSLSFGNDLFELTAACHHLDDFALLILSLLEKYFRGSIHGDFFKDRVMRAFFALENRGVLFEKQEFCIYEIFAWIYVLYCLIPSVPKRRNILVESAWNLSLRGILELAQLSICFLQEVEGIQDHINFDVRIRGPTDMLLFIHNAIRRLSGSIEYLSAAPGSGKIESLDFVDLEESIIKHTRALVYVIKKAVPLSASDSRILLLERVGGPVEAFKSILFALISSICQSTLGNKLLSSPGSWKMVEDPGEKENLWIKYLDNFDLSDGASVYPLIFLILFFEEHLFGYAFQEEWREIRLSRWAISPMLKVTNQELSIKDIMLPVRDIAVVFSALNQLEDNLRGGVTGTWEDRPVWKFVVSNFRDLDMRE